MIIVTTSDIKGKEVKKVIGLVKGSTIRARHLGKDIMAGFRGGSRKRIRGIISPRSTSLIPGTAGLWV